MRHCSFQRLLACLAAAMGLFVAESRAAAQSKLPDAWFFPDRPEALKGLEGKATPELKLKTWIGDKVSVPDSKGKVVVIDFWATWCGPCMAAVPKNIEIVKKYKDQGLVFLGVHDANSGWDQAQSVVTEKGINYSVVRDEDGGLSAKAFNLAFWPTYVVIDRSGIVRGAGLAPNNLEEAVKLLLAEAAPAGGVAAKSAGPPPEWFYGGADRPSSLGAIEGKPMPAIEASRWQGSPLSASEIKDRVVVLHFLSTDNSVSMTQAEELAKLGKELGPQGVLVVGVCPARQDWDALVKAGAEEKLPARLCQEAPAADTKTPGFTGKITSVFGVRYLPATIVIDRRGVVRAAGVRTESVKEIAGKLLAESVKPTVGN